MKILDNISPIFDSNGHFYLEYNNQVYEFSIDNKNNLELFKIHNNDNYQFRIHEESEDNFSEKKELNLLVKSNTLKSKIIREYIKEKEDNPDDEYESDDELDTNAIEDINAKMQYFPEDLEYIENASDSDENNTDLRFEFYGNMKIKKLVEVDITEINEINGNHILEKDNIVELSNYDTFMYNGDNEHSELVFISKLNNINSSYRILAFKDGTVILKIVGYARKNYKIKKDDNLSLEKI